MNAISIELLEPLPDGLKELYKKVNSAAKAIGCDYLVVGATARDMVLAHGFGAHPERQTLDVDFGINVPTWSAFTGLKAQLVAEGFTESERAMQRLYLEAADKSWQAVDIVPFGAIENDESVISWPPQHDMAMSVLGFKEALNSAFSVVIDKNPDVTILVASPAGICLLKLIAWLDRPAEKRGKDAEDIRYLIANYSIMPEVRNSIYDKHYMEAQGWDETKASAMKLGADVRKIASQKTMAFLEEKLFKNAASIEALAREMSPRGSPRLQENFGLLQILLSSIASCNFESGE